MAEVPKIKLVYSSVYAILGGLSIDYFAPMFTNESTNYTLPLKCIGVMGLAYFAWHYSKFDHIYRNMKFGFDDIYPIQKKFVKGEYSNTYIFTLPNGKDVEELISKKGAIEQALGKKVAIEYINKGLFKVEVFKHTSSQMYDYDNEIQVDGDIAFPIGFDLYERLVTCVLSNCDAFCHMLIAGTTGGGKSTFLNTVVTYLLTHKNVDMYLHDYKGTELPIYEKCKNVKDVCYDSDEAYGKIKELVKLMKNRNKTFRENGVRDIKGYNKKFKKNPMRYIVIVIDEFSELMNDKATKKELITLASQSRSAGMSLIVATQRPDAKVFDSLIKNNFNVVVGLKTNTAINSRIIIENDSLKSLRGHGHLIFRYGNKDVELQDMFISDKEIERLIKPFEVEKPKQNPNIPVKAKEDDFEELKINYRDYEGFRP